MSPASDNFSKSYRSIEKAVKGFGRYRKRWEVLLSWGRFGSIGIAPILLWVLLDWVFELPLLAVFGTFVVVAIFALVTLLKWVVVPPWRRIRRDHEANVVEELHGKLNNRIIGSLQLGGEVLSEKIDKTSASTPMVRALVVRTSGILAETKLKSLLDLRRTWKFLGVAMVILAGYGSLGHYAPQVYEDRYNRTIEGYYTLLDLLFPVDFEISPGDLRMVRGDAVELEARVIGARRDEGRLVKIFEETGETTTEVLKLKDEKVSVTLEGDQTAANFRYRFEYANEISQLHLVEVEDRPLIQAINFELEPPEYTGQSMRLITGKVAKLEGLPGTKVLVSFAANTPLDAERTFWETSTGIRDPIEVNGRYGTFQFEIVQNEILSINLTGHFGEGFEMERPQSISIIAQSDEPPSINILTKLSEKELVPGQAAGLPVAWRAEDDFGLSEVRLDYTITSLFEVLNRQDRKGSRVVELDPPRDRARSRFTGIFSGTAIYPGDKVTITLLARDNRPETPGVGRSRTIEFVVVGNDLGQFVSGQDFGFRRREESALKLEFAERIGRSTDLLQDPVKTLLTEAKFPLGKHDVAAATRAESVPFGLEELISQYFQLLSGAQ